MRALSVRQPWAELIAQGKKKIEYRTWQRSFRGDLLIVSSVSRHDEDCIEEGLDPEQLAYGSAVCVVDLSKVTGIEGDYRWHLRDPRRVAPEKIQGFASIYNVDDARIRFSGAKAAPLRAPKRVVRPKAPKGVPSILVVASDVARARSWKASLDAIGCAVLSERDGFGAWKRLQTETGIGCVVLDAKIQGWNALEVVHRMRASELYASTPIVLAGASRGANSTDAANVFALSRLASAATVAEAVRSAVESS